MLDADFILDSIKKVSEAHYSKDDEQFRKSFYIGMLESKLKEFVYMLKNAEDEIKHLQTELIAKDSK